VSERLIAEALAPYPDGLVIATKGLPRHPRRLREAVEGSLRRLRVERIELYQLARINPGVPAEDQFGALAELREQGKIRHVGLSEVRTDEVEAARAIVPVVSVQNRYSLADRAWEAVLDYCEREGLGFLPWFPLGAGRLAEAGGALVEAAGRHGATPAQVALAWLLRRSPVMLPIPGTSSVAHLEENVAAAALQLPAGQGGGRPGPLRGRQVAGLVPPHHPGADGARVPGRHPRPNHQPRAGKGGHGGLNGRLGLLPLTVPEVRRLLVALVWTRPVEPSLVLAWSRWRRRDQARRRRAHYQRRERKVG
jgi:pyridoxine 4-dehydrogenase